MSLKISDPACLVSSDWLYAQINQQNDDNHVGIKILDGTYLPAGTAPSVQDRFLKAHIPGSIYFDIDVVADQQSTLPHMLPTAEIFKKHVEHMGICEKHHVVAYDQMGIFSSARVWWMFKCFGHPSVSVLDGGLPVWLENGFPVSQDLPVSQGLCENAHVDYRLNQKVPVHLSRLIDVQRALDDRSVQIIDARSPDRFLGHGYEPWNTSSGLLKTPHIPGSINVFYRSLLNYSGLDYSGMALLEPDRIKAVFDSMQVDFSKKHIVYCGSGVTACIVALAFDRIGHHHWTVYDGSWAEWQAQDVPRGTRL